MEVCSVWQTVQAGVAWVKEQTGAMHQRRWNEALSSDICGESSPPTQERPILVTTVRDSKPSCRLWVSFNGEVLLLGESETEMEVFSAIGGADVQVEDIVVTITEWNSQASRYLSLFFDQDSETKGKQEALRWYRMLAKAAKTVAPPPQRVYQLSYQVADYQNSIQKISEQIDKYLTDGELSAEGVAQVYEWKRVMGKIDTPMQTRFTTRKKMVMQVIVGAQCPERMAAELDGEVLKLADIDEVSQIVIPLGQAKVTTEAAVVTVLGWRSQASKRVTLKFDSYVEANKWYDALKMVAQSTNPPPARITQLMEQADQLSAVLTSFSKVLEQSRPEKIDLPVLSVPSFTEVTTSMNNMLKLNQKTCQELSPKDVASQSFSCNFMLLFDVYKCVPSSRLESEQIVRVTFSVHDSLQKDICFFGLQYVIKKYLEGTVLTTKMLAEAESLFKQSCPMEDTKNREVFKANWEYIIEKYQGRLPLSICAIDEGSVLKSDQVVMTMENTDPACHWLPPFLEPLLQLLWYPTAICSVSRQQRDVIERSLHQTGSGAEVREGRHRFNVQDFDYGKNSSVESAALGGCAHLAIFDCCDFPAARLLARDIYGAEAGVCRAAADDPNSTSPQSMGQANTRLPNASPSVQAIIYTGKECLDFLQAPHISDLVSREDECSILLLDEAPENEECLQMIQVLQKVSQLVPLTETWTGHKLLPLGLRIMAGNPHTTSSMEKLLSHVADAGWATNNIVFRRCENVRSADKLETVSMRSSYEYISPTRTHSEEEETRLTRRRGAARKCGNLQTIAEKPGASKARVRPHVLQEVFCDGELKLDMSLEVIRRNSRWRRIQEEHLNVVSEGAWQDEFLEGGYQGNMGMQNGDQTEESALVDSPESKQEGNDRSLLSLAKQVMFGYTCDVTSEGNEWWTNIDKADLELLRSELTQDFESAAARNMQSSAGEEDTKNQADEDLAADEAFARQVSANLAILARQEESEAETTKSATVEDPGAAHSPDSEQEKNDENTEAQTVQAEQVKHAGSHDQPHEGEWWKHIAHGDLELMRSELKQDFASAAARSMQSSVAEETPDTEPSVDEVSAKKVSANSAGLSRQSDMMMVEGTLESTTDTAEGAEDGASSSKEELSAAPQQWDNVLDLVDMLEQIKRSSQPMIKKAKDNTRTTQDSDGSDMAEAGMFNRNFGNSLGPRVSFEERGGELCDNLSDHAAQAAGTQQPRPGCLKNLSEQAPEQAPERPSRQLSEQTSEQYSEQSSEQRQLPGHEDLLDPPELREPQQAAPAQLLTTELDGRQETEEVSNGSNQSNRTSDSLSPVSPNRRVRSRGEQQALEVRKAALKAMWNPRVAVSPDVEHRKVMSPSSHGLSSQVSSAVSATPGISVETSLVNSQRSVSPRPGLVSPTFRTSALGAVNTSGPAKEMLLQGAVGFAAGTSPVACATGAAPPRLVAPAFFHGVAVDPLGGSPTHAMLQQQQQQQQQQYHLLLQQQQQQQQQQFHHQLQQGTLHHFGDNRFTGASAATLGSLRPGGGGGADLPVQPQAWNSHAVATSAVGRDMVVNNRIAVEQRAMPQGGPLMAAPQPLAHFFATAPLSPACHNLSPGS